MNEQETRRNARLGIFVFVGIIIFLIGIFFIGSARNLFNANITVYAFFQNVDGLQKGNNIWLSGVKIGTVRDVDIVNDSLVRVNLKVREDQARFIHKDAVVSLGSDGLVGNAIVNFNPGRAYSTQIEDGDTVSVQAEFGMADLMTIAEESGPKLQQTIANLADMTGNLKRQITEGNGLVGTLLNDEAVGLQVKQAVANLQATSDRARVVTGQMSQTMTELRSNKQGPLYTLSHDTAFAGTYTKAMADIKVSTQNVANATQELQVMSKKLNSGNNAMSTLLDNEKFAQDLEGAMLNAKDAGRQLDETLEALEYSFFLRGAFRKKNKAEQKAYDDSLKSVGN